MEKNEKYEILTIHHNGTNERKNGCAHCEFLCLEDLNGKDLSSVEVFVTVEPCIMCAYALKLSKIKKVYYYLANPKFGGVESLVEVDLNYERIKGKEELVKEVL